MLGIRRRELIPLLGGAAALPLAARAQRPGLPVIAFLHPASANSYLPSVPAFREGLNTTGYVEGRNVTIEFHFAENDPARHSAMAADTVRRGVSVIVATGGLARAAKAATSTIPIVFAVGLDPVRNGLVANLNRPGGNLTGTTSLADLLIVKQVEMLRELAPGISIIGLLGLGFPGGLETGFQTADLQVAIRGIGLQLRVLPATSQTQFDDIFATAVRERIDAILVQSSPLFTSAPERVVAAAARHGVPTIYGVRSFVNAGGLISYGASVTESARQIGVYAGRILKGEKPADLPIVRPTKFELVINMKAAKALGLSVPLTLQAIADELIE